MQSPQQAIALLARLGAAPWLVRHHELVVEAAVLVCDGVERLAPGAFDRVRVQLGAALHDAGKIVVPEEMREPGHRHEAAGRTLLEEHGVDGELARFCVTHAAWDASDCTLDDLLVALADKLWKGKREEALEARVRAMVVAHTGRAEWEIFDALDRLCEAIAADGPSRLARSKI